MNSTIAFISVVTILAATSLPGTGFEQSCRTSFIDIGTPLTLNIHVELFQRSTNCFRKTRYLKSPISYYNNSSATFNSCILRHGDVESNPGPTNDANVHSQNKLTHNKLSNSSCIIFNARSLRNKLIEFRSFFETSSPDIIGVTETWFSELDTTIDIHFPDHVTFRRDRVGTRGGGVFLAIKPYLTPKRRPQLENAHIEMVCVEISGPRSHAKWLMCVLYRPPSASTEFWEHLQHSIDDIQAESSNYHGMVIAGDFNVNWADQELPAVRQLDSIMSPADFTQLVDEITRRSLHDPLTGTTIDLLFTNASQHIDCVKTAPNPVSSDHDAISFNIGLHKLPSSKTVFREFLRYDKTDVDHFNALVKYAPWDLFFDETDVDKTWEGYLDIFDAISRDCIPRKKGRTKQRTPWIGDEIRKLVVKKKKAFKRAKQSNSDSHWRTYKDLRNKVKQASNRSYHSYINTLFSDNSDNRKRFFSFVRSQKKSPDPLTINDNGSVIHEPGTIAELFGRYFNSVFTPPPDSVCPTSTHDEGEESLISYLSSIEIKDNEVLKIIQGLKKEKSPGPDGITPMMLKLSSHSITPVLCKFFRLSLSLGVVPQSWKQANITPIFKSGDKTLVKNYRPIALTSIICKILERVVTDALQSHLSDNCLLNPNQHGFVKGRSCVTQLMNITNMWLNLLDRSPPPKIDVIFFDFAKAFDIMPHDLLLTKLFSQFYVSGKIWNWISSFLLGRKQRVIFRGATSSWFSVTSGVPQGSVLGPCLFNLFINDLLSQTQSKCVLFADDTLLYKPVYSPLDSLILQHDIDRIHSWCVQNKMTINTAKSKVLRITWARNPGEPHYFYNDTRLDSVSEYKYLGVMINNKLSWNTHVDYVIKKANRMFGFILSVSKSLTPSSVFSLFKTIVLPIIEYGQPVWHLHHQNLIGKIENVQRRVTRIVLKQRRQEMAYQTRLQLLNWQSLECRRKFTLIVYIMKALYGLVRCDAVRRNIVVNGRHLETVRFNHLRARTNRLHLSAINSFPRYWDELPDNLRSEVVENSLQSWVLNLKQFFTLY